MPNPDPKNNHNPIVMLTLKPHFELPKTHTDTKPAARSPDTHEFNIKRSFKIFSNVYRKVNHE